MFIDIPTLVVVVLIFTVAWQQYTIFVIQDHLDVIIDKHNDLADAVVTGLHGILDITYEDKDNA
tara:strand:- start:2523 stop:2714 length:192 start_codon:yes stop_codon:yes gene_type:complete